MKPIIKATNVSKQYKIGSGQNSFVTLRETLSDVIRSPLRRFKASNENRILALKEVSFEIAAGEVIGIIGRNGAGKSTLLKVLARITEPSAGRVEIYGRIGSILEVGTGFHPELTGRENIYLNGAILGMSRAEIQRKFDEIVAFAEIEAFLDTQVKRYSSGMHLRLAFAVAAHLDPEILIVDEVLAVGDASFQRKCLDKMEDVRQTGRTVIFVSHNMPAVTRLCPRSILLENGAVSFDGPSHEAVGIYLGSGVRTNAAREWKKLDEAPGNEIVRLRSVKVRSEEGEICESINITTPVGIEMEFDVLRPGHVLVPNYKFVNQEGICAFVASEQDPNWRRRPRPTGRYVSTAWIPGNFLSEGSLVIDAAISTMDSVRVHVFERDVVAFQVIDTLDGNSARGDFGGSLPGVVRPLLKWTSRFTSNNSSQAGDPST